VRANNSVVPGAPLLIHKLIEGRYRHHAALIEAARRHSGLPPIPAQRPPPPRKPHDDDDDSLPNARGLAEEPVTQSGEQEPAEATQAGPAAPASKLSANDS
jgi:hypothetical protein